MKIKSFALFLCLILLQSAFAGLDSNFLKKRWKATVHTKKNKDIKHHEDDFLHFNSSGFLEKVESGLYLTGKWSFNAENNTLTIHAGESKEEWTISELTAKTLKASRKNETLEMEVVPLKYCNGDPYADITMICGKWKVANHIANYSRVSHSPADYIQFFDDGMVEEVYRGRYRKMTWKYENGKLIFSDFTWNVKDLNTKQMKAEVSSKNESLVLRKF